MNTNVDIQTRIDELSIKINEIHVNDHESDREDELESLMQERDDLLASTWADSNGLLTGAIDWIEKNIQPNDSYIFMQSIEEGVLGGETSRQIGLFHDAHASKNPKKSLFTITYQTGLAHFVKITQYEATISVRENETPYRVYRPFLNSDGTKTYRLVREVIVQNYDLVEEPAYLHYLFTQALKILHDLICHHEEFHEGLDKEMFLDIAAPSSLPLYNYRMAPTTQANAKWLIDYRIQMNRFDSMTPLAVIESFVRNAAAELYTLCIDVRESYVMSIHLDDEKAGYITDCQLDDIDSTVSSDEISMYS